QVSAGCASGSSDLVTVLCLSVQADPVSQKQNSVSILSLSPQGDLQRSLIQVDFGDGIAVSYANLSSTSPQGDLQRSLIQVDFGDGIAVSYANLSSTEDGIKHIYQNVGIFRVTALVENSLGSDSAVLYLHVTCPLEHVHLSLPFVTTKNKEINATAVLWPSQVGTLTYVWWFGNNTEPLITLEGSITFTFSVEGMNTITVQVSAGNTILQDTKTIAVYEKFQSLRLSFSPNLDDYNPDIPEWRRDISRVVKRALVEATGISSKHVLVAVLPGLPTSAELFILPYQDATGEKKRAAANLEQISEMLIQKLNQNLVHFELKPGVRILVHAAHLTAGECPLSVYAFCVALQHSKQYINGSSVLSAFFKHYFKHFLFFYITITTPCISRY
uniref:PKD domain-containing protein n=1 Tax=Ficedula albicollis TaxID=59894 RepID=A0A803VM65_FICAL